MIISGKFISSSVWEISAADCFKSKPFITSADCSPPGTFFCKAETPVFKNNAPTTLMAIQIPNCVKATSVTPRIFPIISSNGFTEEMIISTTRLFFSSNTLRITRTP